MKTICGKCGNKYKHKKDCPINIAETLMRKRPKNIWQWYFIKHWCKKLLTQ